MVKSPIQMKPSPHLILSVDTSTVMASVALVRGSEVIAESGEEAASPRTQNSRLLEDIAALLRAAKIELRAVDAFAVAAGPGSFTGVRTGMATVKAFASALARPVVAVPTLHAVARAEATNASQFVVALTSTGRSELFAQILEVNAGGVREISAARHVTVQALLYEMIDAEMPEISWVGDGARKIETSIGERARELGIAFVDSTAEASVRAMRDDSAERSWTVAQKPYTLLARHVALIAQAKLNEAVGDVEADAHSVNPIYVRPACRIQR